jgi:hypothetical protein
LQEANCIQRSEGFGQSFYPDPSYLLCAALHVKCLFDLTLRADSTNISIYL